MSLTKIICPECGNVSEDLEWCDHCGAPLFSAGGKKEESDWITAGSTIELEVEPEQLDLGDRFTSRTISLRFEILEVIESYATRRRATADLVGVGGSDNAEVQGAIRDAFRSADFIIEEREQPSSAHRGLPTEVRERLRQPFLSTKYNNHHLDVFVDFTEINLAELMTAARGKLTYFQVKKIYSALLDAVLDLHENDLLHLRLSPWSVRLRGEGLLDAVTPKPSAAARKREDVSTLELEGDEIDQTNEELQLDVDVTNEFISIDAHAPTEGELDDASEISEAQEQDATEAQDEGDSSPSSGEATADDEPASAAGDESQETSDARSDDADSETSDALSDDADSEASDAPSDDADSEASDSEDGEESTSKEGTDDLASSDLSSDTSEEETLDAPSKSAPAEASASGSSDGEGESAASDDSGGGDEDPSGDVESSAQGDESAADDQDDSAGGESEGEVEASEEESAETPGGSSEPAQAAASDEEPAAQDALDYETIDAPNAAAIAQEDMSSLKAGDEFSGADIFDDEREGDDAIAFDDTIEARLEDLLAREAAEEEEDFEVEVVFDVVEGFFEKGIQLDRAPVVMNFSPPEMFSKVRTEIDTRCDVFSLGMLLYYMLSGQLPPTSIYTRHTSAIPARNFRPDFPLGLNAVIQRATRPDPDNRYPDTTAFKNAFDNACELIEQRLRGIDEENIGAMQLAVDRHVGIAKGRRNPTNQDSIFGAVSDDGRFGLIVVADGVSTASYGSGDLASDFLRAEATATWEEILPTYLMDEEIDPVWIIQQILDSANADIIDYVNEHYYPFFGNPHEVMGTTALVALFHEGIMTLGALGDSRGYLQRGSGLEQITTDHNLWTLSILEGVPADNALALPHGDALARCLGTFVVESQRLIPVSTQPDIFQFPVTRGDTLLLSTDGLIDFAGANMLHAEDNVLSVLLSEPDPALACLELILLANRGGGGDNIGVAIAKFY